MDKKRRIEIKKGLDIHLKGKAPEEVIQVGKSDMYAIVPDHYVGIIPKVLVHEGDRVNAGTPLMMDKTHPEIKIVAPVSGKVTGINRGEKRKILSITIQPDDDIIYEPVDVAGLDRFDVADYDSEGLKALLLQMGMWPFIRQRPYDRVADPTVPPRDIFVTAFNSAPLAPDCDFIVKGEEDVLQTGLSALKRLTNGTVYLGIKDGSPIKEIYEACKDVMVVHLSGPHPAGNVGVMINALAPVNKGEVVWTLNAGDVITIGRLFKEKRTNFAKTIAVTGSECLNTGYARVVTGCTIGSIISGNIADGHVRLISGNVLTGTKVGKDDFLGAYDYQITAIPEGDDVDEFAGWAMPGFGKFSVSRTFFTWLTGKKKEYVIDARLRGGKRAMIMSNEYDKVFPMDILPEYLLKAIIAFDIDKMENLGIYEVAPEDFALCEFVDTSKMELQMIVCNGLDLLYKEMN